MRKRIVNEINSLDFADFNRALNYNKIWFTRFKWIMPFVKSEKMNCELAIAEIDNNMFIINQSGELISVIDDA
jgi:hypothetical protein